MRLVIGLLLSALCATAVLGNSTRDVRAPGFRKTTRGQVIESRSQVPVSGVVLFHADTPFERVFSPLDFAGPDGRCNQDSFGSLQNEIVGSANPINTNIVLSGSNDYRSGDASGGFYATLNGGGVWSDALVTRGPVLDNYDAAGDPVTVIARNGQMYAAYIAFDRETDGQNGIYVQSSTDNGSTWNSPVPVVQHRGTPPFDFEDKPFAACDISPGSPYLNNLYVTWTKFTLSGLASIYVSRSINGGVSFSAPIQISASNSTQFSCPTVGPNGEVYVTFFSYASSTIKFDHSTNGGVSWNPDVTVSSFNDNFPPNPCGDFRTPAYPVIACDIYTGPRRGWIYVCWADARNGNPDIFFSRSTNGGSTWSAASRVDNDPSAHWQWWQWMSVNPNTGDIGISWLDRREDPASCRYRTYGTVSTDGGTTWDANFPISSVTSDPTNSTFLGDYCGAAFRSDGFYSLWTDLRNDGGDVYAATFGSSLMAPSDLVITTSAADAILHWTTTGAPYYKIYSALVAGGPYTTLEGSSTSGTFTDSGALSDQSKFYQVVASTTP